MDEAVKQVIGFFEQVAVLGTPYWPYVVTILPFLIGGFILAIWLTTVALIALGLFWLNRQVPKTKTPKEIVTDTSAEDASAIITETEEEPDGKAEVPSN